jgi:hypothetical protein
MASTKGFSPSSSGMIGRMPQQVDANIDRFVFLQFRHRIYEVVLHGLTI